MILLVGRAAGTLPLTQNLTLALTQVWSFSSDEEVDAALSGRLGDGSARLPLFAFLENEPRMQLSPGEP